MLKKLILYIPSVAVPMVVNVVMVYLYAKHLKPENYGILNLYLNTINIIYAAVLSFIQTAAFRFYSIRDYYESRKQYLSTFVLCNLAITIALLAISYIVNLLFFKFNYMLIATSVGINALFQFYLNLYRLEGRNKSYVFTRIASSLLTLVVFVLLVTVSGKVTYNQIIWITYGMYAVFVIAAIATQREKFSYKSVSIELLKKSFQYGLPMMGVTLMGNIISSSAQYILKYYLNDDAVGLYSLGYKISDMSIANITMLILLIATPSIMKVYDQASKNDSIDTLSKVLQVNNWVIFLFAFEIIFYADNIIKLIFPGYVGAESIIRLVAIAAVLHSISLITCKPYELNKKTGLLCILLIITAAINAGYNAIFIPVYGLDAAAHSSILAYIIYNMLLHFKCEDNERMSFDRVYYGKIVIALSAAFVVAILLNSVWELTTPLTLIIQAVISACVYGIVSIILGIHKLIYKI
jgi:O-antigen/teichoic acid export membrane protein